MGPEVLFPALFDRSKGIEVLKLGEGEECGCDENIDAKDRRESIIVNIEWILKAQASFFIGVHYPGILHHIYVSWRPARCNV